MLNNLFKLSSVFLSNTNVIILNKHLAGATGFDYFERILNRYGFSIGKSFAKNRYYLIKNDEKISNAYLKGNHEKIEIIPKEPKVPKKRIPSDAYYSSGSIYDKIEKDASLFVYAASLQEVFTQYNLSPDIQSFLQNIPQQDLQHYLPEIKKNPNIGLSEIQAIVPKVKEQKIKENQNTQQEFNYVENIEDPYKTWALIQFKKLRRIGLKDDYAWFKLKLRTELRDWFINEHPEIASYTWKTAIEASDKWHKAISEGAGEVYLEGNKNVVYGPKWNNKEWNGWTIKRVMSENDLTVESEKMDNCVKKYFDQISRNVFSVYSLRDPNNDPHITFAEQPPGSKSFKEILGKGNSDPLPEYKQMLGEWFKTLGEGVYVQDIMDIYDIENLDDISNGNVGTGDLLSEISNKLNSANEYGLEQQFNQGDIDNLFQNIISESKKWNKRQRTPYTPDDLYKIIEVIVKKAIGMETNDLHLIKKLCGAIQEEEFEQFVNWSDGNYSAYSPNFNIEDFESEEKYHEAIDDAMQQDFDDEIKNIPPYSLARHALEIINKETRT